MDDTTHPTHDAPAMRDYECRVYHLETYVACPTVRAENPQEALDKLKALEEYGELYFGELCDSEPANEFIVETPEGEIRESHPEYCLYALQNRCRELAVALAAILQWWAETPHSPNDDEMPATLFDAAMNALAKAKCLDEPSKQASAD
jgi:hypothetical protein